MQLYNSDPSLPSVRPTDSVPVPPNPTHLTATPENTLTFLENIDQFTHVQAAVHQQFCPTNDFQRLLADDLAECLWVRNRFGAIANQALNFALQTTWDDISQRYPDADPALRTHHAWRHIAADPAQIRATDIHSRASRRIHSDIRLLSSLARSK